MKLTSISIGPSGFSEDIPNSGIALSFRDPKTILPYNVISIDGLDAGALHPRYYGSATGQKFYTLEQDPRELVFKIGLNPDFSNNETYSKLRDAVYKIITKSKSGRVDIHFKNETHFVAILTGFVTKISTDPSNKDQQILVTINCEDPVLRSPISIPINYDLFDFNDFLIHDNISTAPHGISFRLKIDDPLVDLIIGDPTDASWNLRVIPIGGFHAGEVLYFSSEFGRKQIRTRARNLMSRVTGKSIWPVVFPGENHFSFNHPASLSLQKLSHYRAYWGV